MPRNSNFLAAQPATFVEEPAAPNQPGFLTNMANATAGVEVESTIVAEAEEPICKNVECSICSKTMKSPKLLECMHTFCESCIGALIANNTVKCPECDEVKQLPNGIESLHTNYVIENEIAVKKNGSDKPKCQDCVSKVTATKYCQDCRMNLCSKCDEIHQTRVRFARHKIVDICDAPSKGMVNGKRYCPKHDELLKYFCETCKLSVCNDCQLSNTHRGHHISLASEVQERVKNELNASIEQAEKVDEVFKTHKKAGEDFLKEINKSDAASVELIKDIFEEAKEELLKRRDEIIESIKTQSNTKSFTVFCKSSTNHHKLLHYVKSVKAEFPDNMEITSTLQSQLKTSLDKNGAIHIVEMHGWQPPAPTNVNNLQPRRDRYGNGYGAIDLLDCEDYGEYDKFGNYRYGHNNHNYSTQQVHGRNNNLLTYDNYQQMNTTLGNIQFTLCKTDRIKNVNYANLISAGYQNLNSV